MKTDSQISHTSRALGAAIGFALLLLAIFARSVVAQTNTSPFPSSGNVGIGTTTPNAPLEINNNQNAYSDSFRLNNPSTGSSAQASFSFYEGSTQKAKLAVNGTGVTGFVGGVSALQIWNFSNAPIAFGTNSAERMRIDSSGNVGIGATSPGAPLEIRRDQNAVTDVYVNNATAGSGTGAYTGLRFYEGATLKALLGSANSGSSGYSGGASAVQLWNFQNAPILFATNSLERVRIDSTGNVGIGTPNPLSNVQVGTQASASTANPVTLSLGGTYSSSSGVSLKLKLYDDGVTANTYGIGVSSGSMDFGVSPAAGYHWYAGGVNKMTLTNDGSLTVSGNISAKYQDVAEWVPASEKLAAGTVVVLDSTKSNQVISSTVSYDTRVAGVISEQPGIALGEKSENKVLVATTGRVRVRVDASHAAIRIGDLLVTSDIPGVAMKSEPIEIGGRKMHMPGTLIGKALEPWAKGSAEILVLLSLQ